MKLISTEQREYPDKHTWMFVSIFLVLFAMVGFGVGSSDKPTIQKNAVSGEWRCVINGREYFRGDSVSVFRYVKEREQAYAAQIAWGKP